MRAHDHQASSYLAVKTFGISHLTRKDTEQLPFYPCVPRVLQGARSAPGFSKIQPKLGDLVHPRFYDEESLRKNLEVSQVLFLWDDVDPVLAFSYNGIHREALLINKENAWFSNSRWPSYVAWWWTQVDEVRWDVGCRKLEDLKDQGSTDESFNVHLPFDTNDKYYCTEHD